MSLQTFSPMLCLRLSFGENDDNIKLRAEWPLIYFAFHFSIVQRTKPFVSRCRAITCALFYQRLHHPVVPTSLSICARNVEDLQSNVWRLHQGTVCIVLRPRFWKFALSTQICRVKPSVRHFFKAHLHNVRSWPKYACIALSTIVKFSCRNSRVHLTIGLRLLCRLKKLDSDLLQHWTASESCRRFQRAFQQLSFAFIQNKDAC